MKPFLITFSGMSLGSFLTHADFLANSRNKGLAHNLSTRNDQLCQMFGHDDSLELEEPLIFNWLYCVFLSKNNKSSWGNHAKTLKRAPILCIPTN